MQELFYLIEFIFIAYMIMGIPYLLVLLFRELADGDIGGFVILLLMSGFFLVFWVFFFLSNNHKRK